MNNHFVLSAVLFAAIAATGCASKGNKDLPPPPSDAVYDGGIATSGAGGVAASGSGNAIATPPTKPVGPGYDLTSKLVYFDYDSADINTAGQGVIANYGKYLTVSPSAKIRLEGHTDERGSSEYNVALGERRAQTVARELKAAGVTDAQLSIVSYGEERPAAPGSSEESYALNRRVEFVQP